VPATGVAPGPVTANVVVEIVDAIIASLNETVITATPVAPLAGFVELIVGAVVSTVGLTVFLLDAPHPAITTSSAASGIAMRLRVRSCIRSPSCCMSGASGASCPLGRVVALPR
jgi:hypothetical protein